MILLDSSTFNSNLFTIIENNPITISTSYISRTSYFISVPLIELMMIGPKIPPKIPHKIPKGELNTPRKQWYPNGELARERVYDEEGDALVDP